MITEVEANLLEYPVDGIIHQANCFHIMGGGIAARIKAKFPEAYEADLKTPSGDENKMGTFSFAVLPSNYHIYNVYGQFGLGNGRETRYDALYEGLRAVRFHAEQNALTSLGLPKRMGCVLGGGSWRIVRAIVGEVFDASPLNLHICDYGG